MFYIEEQKGEEVSKNPRDHYLIKKTFSINDNESY